MKAINNILIVGLITLLTSCGEAPFYEKSVSFDNREWKDNVKPSFKIKVDDIKTPYDFKLSLRTSTDYKYSNLWIFLKTTTPDGTTAREPYQITITNDDGSWIGEKSGSVVTSNLTFSSRKLPKKGNYTFTVELGITESTIDEVHDLTFTVDKNLQEIRASNHKTTTVRV